MIRSPPQIDRPRLLGGLAGLSAAAGLAACLVVLTVAGGLPSSSLVPIRAGAEQLEATLANAAPALPGATGNVVWVVTAPDCGSCEDFTVRVITELQRDGVEVRVLTLRPGGNGPRHRVLRAVAAENGAAMELPALFWRRGVEWRGAFGNSVDPEQLREDIEPEA